MGEARVRTVRTLLDPTGKRRVRIVERDDGAFVATPEYWYETHWEGQLVASGWGRLPARNAYYASVEIADREARLEYDWASVPQP